MEADFNQCPISMQLENIVNWFKRSIRTFIMTWIKLKQQTYLQIEAFSLAY